MSDLKKSPSKSSKSSPSKKDFDVGRKPTPIRLLMIGDSGVGKTAMLVRYTDDLFDSTYITTIGIDFKIKNVDLDGFRYKLQIWDTAGQERFRTITRNYFRGAMGIIIMYDVTRRESFNAVTRWISDIEAHSDDSSPVPSIVLVANKIDLVESFEVSCDEGRNLANKYNIPFFECSSRNNINIDQLFNFLIRDIVKDNKHMPSLRVASAAAVNMNSGKEKGKEDKSCC